MAGAATSASRLGITLQGYDQVIALSQANINESLEYHFSAKPQLCDFNVQLKTQTKESITATLKPPTVEMIDIENADQALYVLQFAKGDYAYWDFSEDEPKKAKMSVKGWKLAFYVDFAMKKMGTIPPKIAQAVQNPGLYSVDQLLVNFGTADLMNFNWDKSLVTGFAKNEDQVSARDTISLFVTKWLNGLKDINNNGSHNILGYAVKVDAEKAGMPLADALKKASPESPSFPPTAVRLQTINYRPGGDAKKSRTDHDFNAFLFTEMTGGRKMISDDLAWSGDLFYESIGGTLIMSRGIFWDKFMKPKLIDVCKKNLEALSTAWQDWTKTQVFLGTSKYTWTTTYWKDDGLGCNSTTTFRYDTTDGRGKSQYMEAEATDTIDPLVAEGRVKITHKLRILEGAAESTNSQSKEIRMTWADWVNLKSVNSGGVLTAEVTSEIDSKTDDGKQRMAWIVTAAKGISYKVDLKDTIEAALNSQGHFVFPGGGDFEMKDPLFNKAGDLMIGLTYKKGDAAK